MSRLYIVTLQITSCKMLGFIHEAQAGMRIGGRNINSIRYADDTTLMAERKEKRKSKYSRDKC